MPPPFERELPKVPWLTRPRWVPVQDWLQRDAPGGLASSLGRGLSWITLKRARQAPQLVGGVPVLAVGGLNIGGSGRTPVALFVVEWLRDRGLRPVLLSHGYGGRERAPRLALDVDFVRDGDEAAAARLVLPADVAVVVGRPWRAAVELSRRHGDVVVVDGGVPSATLPRSAEIIAFDASAPRRLLPAGSFRLDPEVARREFPRALSWGHRADEPGVSDMALSVRGMPMTAVVESRVRATHLIGRHGERLPLELLNGRDCVLLSGVGQPRSFEHTVRALGANIVEHRVRGDHAPLQPRHTANIGAGVALVTTTKDAVRLPASTEALVVHTNVEIVNGLDEFGDFMRALTAGLLTDLGPS